MKKISLLVFLILSSQALFGMQPLTRDQQKLLNKQLYEVIEKNDPKVVVGQVAALLEQGAQADVNYRELPLIKACRVGNIEVVKLLIAHGASVNPAISKYSCLPLQAACIGSNAEIVEFLIECGADVNSRTKIDYSPLHVACKQGDSELADILIKKGGLVSAKGVFAEACESGNIKLVKKLLCDHQANVNDKNISKGNSCLFWAINSGNYKLVELLVERAARVEHSDLRSACFGGHIDILFCMLRNMARPMQLDWKDKKIVLADYFKNKAGLFAPLPVGLIVHIFSFGGQTKKSRIALVKNHILSQDSINRTLFDCVKSQSPNNQFVSIFDPQSWSNDEQAEKTYAILLGMKDGDIENMEKGKSYYIDRLGSAYSNISMKEYERQSSEVARVNQIQKIKCGYKLGNTLLHNRAQDNNRELVSYHLKKGVIGLDARNEDQETPLHIAASLKDPSIALCMMQSLIATARIAPKMLLLGSRQKQCPLSKLPNDVLAHIRSFIPGPKKIQKILEIKDAYGKTAFDISKKSGSNLIMLDPDGAQERYKQLIAIRLLVLK